LCPTCGKVAARQLSAGGGLRFKGSGFYITDYGKDGKKSQAAVTAAGDAGTKSGGESSGSKTESSGATEKGSSTGSEGGSSKPPAETKSAASSPAPSSKKPKASE